MTENTQKYLKNLPDLRFESQQTEAKGLGIITTYFVYKKRTVVRHHKDKIENIEDVDNDEEEKDEHESEMFQDSEDSHIKQQTPDNAVEETKVVIFYIYITYFYLKKAINFFFMSHQVLKSTQYYAKIQEM